MRQALVSAKNGALVRGGVELSTALVGEPLAAGTAVRVEDEATCSRGVRRLRISDPAAGWLSRKVVKLAPRAAAPRPPPRRNLPSAASMRERFNLPPMPSNHPCPLQRLAPGVSVATIGVG